MKLFRELPILLTLACALFVNQAAAMDCKGKTADEAIQERDERAKRRAINALANQAELGGLLDVESIDEEVCVAYDERLAGYAFPEASTFEFIIEKSKRLNTGNLKALKLVIVAPLTEKQITTIISFIPKSLEYLEIDLGENFKCIHIESIKKYPELSIQDRNGHIEWFVTNEETRFPELRGYIFRGGGGYYGLSSEYREEVNQRFREYPFTR